jgi:hypothetical protein
VNTTPRIEPRRTADETAATQADATLWYHAAFCRLGLPMRTPRTAWQRSVADAAVRIEPGSAGLALPAGMMLRLALLHVCDAAVRAEGPVVPMGESVAAMAEALGAGGEARALAEQVERMLAARITVSVDGGVDAGMFDARGRPRAAAPSWRASVRLTGGFHASLAAHAVALDRRVVAQLHDAPLTFDAYAWIRSALSRVEDGTAITAGWRDLFDRFGATGQDEEAFGAAFEAALKVVFEADHSVAIAVDEDGVSLRHASAAREEAPEATTEPPEASVAPAASAPATVAPPAEAPPADTPPAPPPAVAPSGLDRDDPSDRIEGDTISLRSHLTGLPQVIWLRRGYGDDSALVGVTPGTRFDPDRLTVLAVEPIVMEVSGGLGAQECSRVTAWIMANRDLIDDFWAGDVTSFAEITRRVRKVPAPGWR